MPNSDTPSGIRKQRKSRGRGLRTSTGCLICKSRHVKCDEVRPQCAPCAKGQRPCVYKANDDSNVVLCLVSSTQTLN
ncbi:hypothetical protein BDV29DRAFT_164983 [Aspergillus leporis]|uniref:Zn(2)-C6 fungal-type domain-containing protein n=1 Tax=Aspergillus leporis TaxID=41062 RepID=A0A5N5XEJ2_9EURO|nr:hypothetical protein BDV29DRAFT_164983 [Aspergillus leporis]